MVCASHAFDIHFDLAIALVVERNVTKLRGVEVAVKPPIQVLSIFKLKAALMPCESL
jgi:hypothetical protein